MNVLQSRRRFLAGLSATGAASLLGPRLASAESAPLETTVVRFAAPDICTAPQYVAEQLLRADGFSDVAYGGHVPGLSVAQQLAFGELDFAVDFASTFLHPIDTGSPIKVLSGVHVGCYELFARDGIRSVLDLKGKRVGAGSLGGSESRVLISAMASYVGLDPKTDIDWVTSWSEPPTLFNEGKIDAFLSFPPEAQRLRAENIGNVIVNSSLDRPWSQYFCCMLAANAGFVEKHPVATKRVLRAVLKAADICASDPDMVAQLLVEGGYAPDYVYAAQALREIPFTPWRDFDPEDTIRFFALRLHEAGIVYGSPQKIIADGTDWRFLKELKRELKA
jgi:NitT/TauT family transport system substrate-binding protein